MSNEPGARNGASNKENSDGHASHHVDRDHDSSGGRISSHRRSLVNIALEVVATGHAIERISKLVDRVPGPRRRLEILRACDEVATLREHIGATEKHLREVAEETQLEFYAVSRPRSVIRWFENWLFGGDQ